VPDTYRLYLPPVQQWGAAVRRSLAVVAACRWTVTPRPGSWPMPERGAPDTSSRASIAARSPAPS